jgi:hypothetical protein
MAFLQLLGLLLVLSLHRCSGLGVRLLLPHVGVVALLLLRQRSTLLFVPGHQL